LGLAPEQRADEEPEVGVVLDDDEHPERLFSAGHTHDACRGRRTAKHEPWGRFDSYHASPPLTTASPRTIDRPRPVPLARRDALSARANLSKRRGTNSSGTPSPWSHTRTSTHVPVSSARASTGGSPDLNAFDM